MSQPMIPLWPVTSTSTHVEPGSPTRFGIAYYGRTVSCTLPLRGDDFGWLRIGLRLQFHDGAEPRYSVSAVTESAGSDLYELQRDLLPKLKLATKAVGRAYTNVTGYQPASFMTIPDSALRAFLVGYIKALKVKQTVSYFPAEPRNDPLDMEGVVYYMEKAVRQVCESDRKPASFWEQGASLVGAFHAAAKEENHAPA